MREPAETRLAAKLEAKLGPSLARWESFIGTTIRIRSLAVLIFAVTTLWWPCRLFHPQFLRFGFMETACLDIMVVGPFANLVLLIALIVSAARAGWPDRGWLLPAVLCGLSPWVVVLSTGVLGSTGLYAD
jgi:hypothetical protein